ncbi:MAG: PAS domain-containing protein [Gemmatimonadota bacterium]
MSKHSRWVSSKSLAGLEALALQKQVSDLKEAAIAKMRVEAALREALELARATLDECPYPLCKLSHEGRLLYANEAMVEFLGYESRKELTDLLPILGLFPTGDRTSGLWQALPNPPAVVDTSCLFRRKDGSYRPGLLRLRRASDRMDYTLTVISSDSLL